MPVLGCRSLEIAHQKDSDGSRQGRLDPPIGDVRYERVQALPLASTNLPQCFPERRFEPHAGTPPPHANIAANQWQWPIDAVWLVIALKANVEIARFHKIHYMSARRQLQSHREEYFLMQFFIVLLGDDWLLVAKPFVIEL